MLLQKKKICGIINYYIYLLQCLRNTHLSKTHKNALQFGEIGFNPIGKVQLTNKYVLKISVSYMGTVQEMSLLS